MKFLGLRLPVLLLFLLGFLLLWLLWLGAYAISPGPSSPAGQIDIVIPNHAGLGTIEKILAAHNVIPDDRRFSMLAVLIGAGGRLQAGEYAIAPGSNPLAIIDMLKKGRVLYRPVTIVEGTAMRKVAELLAAADSTLDAERFLALAHDPAMIAKFGIQAESLEGYLFPDTYYLSRGQQSEAEIITMMVRKHFQVYDEIVQHAGNDQPHLTHHEIITLASIVEKETGNPDERPLVASVFLNRLARGMRLQADPTVRYGLQDSVGPLSQKELKEPTPYNTYVISGLPPGPITNPGKAAIEAVISPARTNYLYFVSKDDKNHYFSATLAEHNKAVSAYRKKK